MLVVDKRKPSTHNNDCNDKKVYFRNCVKVGMIDQGDEKLPPSVYGSSLLLLRLHDSTSTVSRANLAYARLLLFPRILCSMLDTKISRPACVLTNLLQTARHLWLKSIGLSWFDSSFMSRLNPIRVNNWFTIGTALILHRFLDNGVTPLSVVPVVIDTIQCISWPEEEGP